MATLVLTTVGTLVGGPIGGAVGALLGRPVDAALTAPRGRQGPRLDELRLQTSSYGSAIPAIHGRMRVAGTVVWATDLREEASRTGGGKGRPSATNYSYSASFAVLLSARPVRSVGRIWADGNLMRGAAGDFKVATRFRLRRGDEEQAPDPLIAAVEGSGRAPAFRGMAYAVFEDLDLGPYGNRIPVLSFEVEADEGPAEIAAIVAAAGGGAVRGGAGRFHGFATGGDAARGLIETIADAVGARFRDDGAVLHMVAEEADDGVVRRIAPGDVCPDRADGETRLSRMAVPTAIEIAYHDPARDYQGGLQRVRQPGPGRRERRIELPAAVDAAEAKALADRHLDRSARACRRRTLTLPIRHAALRPGDLIGVADEDMLWRIEGWELAGMRLRLRLAAADGEALPGQPPPADPGRPVRQPDRTHGETILAVLELPPADAAASRPTLSVVAAGRSPGWRTATLLLSLDGGARFDPAGATAAPGIIGAAETVLAPAGTALLDMRSSVEVRLTHGEMRLEDADDAGLAGGRNLALIGDELVQFGRAEPVGGDRWLLRRLLRGRRGTERFTGHHVAGERFVLLEPRSIAAIEMPADRSGAVPIVLAAGIGDGAGGVRAASDPLGRSLLPLEPVHVRHRRDPDGRLHVAWIRRSRAGWRWPDGIDAPVAEEAERYRLTIGWPDGTVRVLETPMPAASLAPDDQGAGDGAATLVQIGDHGASPATAFTIPASGAQR